MRKLILHMMTTTDGFIADSERRLDSDWTNWDAEMQDFVNTVFAKAGALLYGRGIYQEMVGWWTAAALGRQPADYVLTPGEVTFARRLTELSKTVVSRTLTEVPDGTVVIRDNLAEHITRLKAQDGGDILLYCGPRLLAALDDLHLIDEYRLYVHPIVLGAGVPLFGQLRRPRRLLAKRIHTFDSGSVLTSFTPLAEPTTSG